MAIQIHIHADFTGTAQWQKPQIGRAGNLITDMLLLKKINAQSNRYTWVLKQGVIAPIKKAAFKAAFYL
jgi:hypothetical protein